MKKFFLNHFSNNNILIILFLFSLTFLTYVNILQNKLFFDDEELIYKNSFVKNLIHFPKYFTTNMIAGAGKISNMYRPILTTSFALDYAIWKNNPTGFHLTSILLHGFNSVLLYFLIKRLFNTQTVALLTSILFIVHPVQSEAVAYAAGRTDLLLTFFSILSIHFFLNSIIKQFKLFRFLVSLLFFILAILSKETAAVLPFIYLLLTNLPIKNKIRFNKLILIFPFMLGTFIYFILRLTILNFENSLNFYQYQNLYSEHISIRFFTFMKVFIDYLGILLFPKDLIIARNVDSIITFPLFWGILFFLMIAICVYIVLRERCTNIFSFRFSFFWYMLFLLPVSGIIPINNIMAEHYLYLPSAGFFYLLSYIFLILWYKFKIFLPRLILSNIFFFICTMFVTRTILRTFDWRNPITFYSLSLEQSPDNIPMRNNLAMAYQEKGLLDQAIQEYMLIIKNNDVYPNIHHNLANAYMQIGKYQEAEEEYIKAITMDPNFLFSYKALAGFYKMKGEKQKYEKIINKMNTLSVPFQP